MTISFHEFGHFEEYPQKSATSDATPPQSKGSLPEVDTHLLRVLYVVIELLGMLRRLHQDSRHASQIRAGIAAQVRWMELLIQQRDDISIEITEQKPDVMRFGARLLCERCKSSTKKNANRNTPQEISSPIWQDQLLFLVTCTKNVSLELFGQDCASSNLQSLPDCLGKLLNTLRRLQRSLASADTQETQIEAEKVYAANKCAECGVPIDKTFDAGP